MSSMNIWHWLIVLVVVVIVSRTTRVNWGDRTRRGMARVPLYSAETTGSTEAEFAGEKLPRRIPLFVIAATIAALLIAALLWIL